jgi:tRNA pseudouridine65 synthase
MIQLRILRRTESWIAVDKPAGFHTHPPENKQLRFSPRWNALGVLERQLGERLFPLHRLDRAASGILLYSRRREANHSLQALFAAGKINKVYYALVRGAFVGDSVLASPIAAESGAILPAETRVSACHSFSLPIPHPRGGMRAFTFVRAEPVTGRFHQIRRHLAQAGFPLIGDSRHGDRKLNREFAALTGCRPLFLRCMALGFECPNSKEAILLANRWGREWHRIFELAGACPLSPSPFFEE